MKPWVCAGVLALTAPASGQDLERGRVRSAIRAGDWESAHQLLGPLHVENPSDERLEYLFAMVLVRTGAPADALALLGEENDPEEPQLAERAFWRSVAFSLLGELDAAIASLESAVERGWNDHKMMGSLPALLALEPIPEYHALQRRILLAEKLADPGFDPLIGEWEVVVERPDSHGRFRQVAQGRRSFAYENHGTAGVDESDCAGTNMFSFDPTRGLWLLYRTGPGALQGRLRFFSGKLKSGSGSFVGGEPWPHADGRPEIKTTWIRFDDHWVEEIYQRSQGHQDVLVERRTHRRKKGE